MQWTQLTWTDHGALVQWDVTPRHMPSTRVESFSSRTSIRSETTTCCSDMKSSTHLTHLHWTTWNYTKNEWQIWQITKNQSVTRSGSFNMFRSLSYAHDPGFHYMHRVAFCRWLSGMSWLDVCIQLFQLPSLCLPWGVSYATDVYCQIDFFECKHDVYFQYPIHLNERHECTSASRASSTSFRPFLQWHRVKAVAFHLLRGDSQSNIQALGILPIFAFCTTHNCYVRLDLCQHLCFQDSNAKARAT